MKNIHKVLLAIFITFFMVNINAQSSQVLKTQTILSNTEVDFMCSLFKVTSNNEEIVKQITKSYNIRDEKSISKLYDKELLRRIVNSACDPKISNDNSNKSRTDTYIEDMIGKLEATFPTQVIQRMISDEKINIGNGSIRQNIIDFLEIYSILNYDADTLDVECLVKTHFNNISQVEQEEINRELNKIQRIFKLTPSVNSVSILLNENLHSAYDICAFPKSKFTRNFKNKIGRKNAKIIYMKACKPN